MIAAKAGPYVIFSGIVQPSMALYMPSGGRQPNDSEVPMLKVPTSTTTTLMFCMDSDLSVIPAMSISLRRTSTARKVLVAAIDWIEAKGSPTRVSVAGKQTIIDFFPLSLLRAGPVRSRGSRD